MTIKEIFEAAENGVLTFQQFEDAVKAGGAKFVDLNEGNYVSKNKYDNEIASRDTQISTLNGTISERDKDLDGLRTQLEAAGTDAEKLNTVTNDLSTLQNKYNADIKEYQNKLKHQAYEFAVREFANSKNFTSNAAKRDFVNSMISKDLKMDQNMILGAEDFVNAYAKDNADAFVVASPEPAPAEPAKPKPTFVSPTQGGEPNNDPTGGFANAFHFTEIHARPNNN